MKRLLGLVQAKANVQTFGTIALRGVGVLFLFGISLLMTNNFPPTVVGEYEFIRVFLLVFGSLCLLGTDVSILFFSGKLKALHSFEEIKNIYFTIIKIISASSILCFGIFFVFFSKAQVDSLSLIHI